jgi:GDP-L-fucose synthase
MKILVTGYSGLVGSALVEELDDPLKINSKNCNLLNMSDVNNFLSKHKPDCVVHCSAKVGGVKNNMENQGSFFYENITMSTNLLESCRLNGVKKVISFLSTCIFPDSDISYPLTEDQVLNGPPHDSNYGYAYAKRMGYVQSKAYRDQYGMNCVSVIPTNIYGPNDNYNLFGGHVIPSLIHKCYLAKTRGDDFVIWGTGSPLREFIFSRDVAKLVVKIIDDYELYPDFEYTSLEDGIAESVEWFCKNYSIVRL